MNNGDFLKKSNISMLWDIISDEGIFKFLPRDSQNKVSEIFINNINGFYEIERKKQTSLISINKKYIILILDHIKTNFSQQTHNKIKILDEAPVKELITYEEIHNDKKSQFEKDLARRQEEFTNAITLKVPEVPEFAEKYKETPISEMDKIIKEMTAKRNYEVEQINRTYQSDINSSNNNWLKPQETSIKSEKNAPIQNTQENQIYNKSKYVHNMNEFVESPSKKIVTWGANNEINLEENGYNYDNYDNNFETNIFKKLKRVDKKQEEQQNSISLTIQENENPSEQRITSLENEVKNLNNKLDTIIHLLQNKIN